jgi:hypothetical protein
MKAMQYEVVPNCFLPRNQVWTHHAPCVQRVMRPNRQSPDHTVVSFKGVKLHTRMVPSSEPECTLPFGPTTSARR